MGFGITDSPGGTEVEVEVAEGLGDGSAEGPAEGVMPGLGEGEGDGVGDGEGVGVGEESGLGVGEGVGVGVGEGVGVGAHGESDKVGAGRSPRFSSKPEPFSAVHGLAGRSVKKKVLL